MAEEKKQNNIAEDLIAEIQKEKSDSNNEAFDATISKDKLKESVDIGNEKDGIVAVDINELLPPSENPGEVKKTGVVIAVILFFMVVAGGFMIYQAMKNTDNRLSPAAVENPVVDGTEDLSVEEDGVESGGDKDSVGSDSNNDSGVVEVGESENKEDPFDWLIRREYTYGFSYKYPDKWEILQDEKLTGVEQNTLFRVIESGERLPIRIQVVRLGLDEFIKVSLRQQYEWVKDIEIDGKEIKQLFYKSPHNGQGYDVYLIPLESGYSLRVMGQQTEELLNPILYSFEF